MKKWFFPIFCLIVVFMDELFATFLTVFSIPLSKGMLQKEYIVISIISYIILSGDVLKRIKEVKHVIWTTMIVGLLMFFTQFFFPSCRSEIYSSYYSALLFFFSGSLSSMIVGSHIGSSCEGEAIMERINFLLPFFVIPIGYIVGTAGLINSKVSVFSEADNILDYQSVSYMMALVFAYSVYLFFLKKWQKNVLARILKILIMPLLVFAPFACFASGGRGGAVLLLVFVAFYFLIFTKSGLFSWWKIVLIAIISFICIFIVTDFVSLESYDGFMRITDNMTKDEGRLEIYNSSINIFLDSPLWGHGLGSIWFKQGIYSHNIVLDILAETGLIGFFIIIPILLFMIYRGYKICLRTPWFIILYVAFIKGFVMDLFSNYWLNTLPLWLLFGFMFNKKVVTLYKRRKI